MALTKQAIVGAALAILDDYGLADLTMRRVADSLGVRAGALYYHVPNKQSLLAAVADHILAERPAVSTPGDPGETLRLWGRGLRSVLLTHRDAAELVASTQVLGLGEVASPAALASALAGVTPQTVLVWARGTEFADTQPNAWKAIGDVLESHAQAAPAFAVVLAGRDKKSKERDR